MNDVIINNKFAVVGSRTFGFCHPQDPDSKDNCNELGKKYIFKF
jgi:hypothetical protein